MAIPTTTTTGIPTLIESNRATDAPPAAGLGNGSRVSKEGRTADSMSPALALTAIVILSAMLAIVSALAGALWMRLRSASQRSTTPTTTVAIPIPATAPTAAVPTRPVRPRPTTRVEPAAPVVAGPTLIAVPDLGMTTGEADRGDDLVRRFGAIWDLADSGASAESIARVTGQPVGQVELILNLRGPATATNGDRS